MATLRLEFSTFFNLFLDDMDGGTGTNTFSEIPKW